MSDNPLVSLCHLVRWSVSPSHQTAWIAFQTVATTAALIAVSVYAVLTRCLLLTQQRLLAVEQTPVLTMDIVGAESVRNVGRGCAISAVLLQADRVCWLGVVPAGGEARFNFRRPDTALFGGADSRLFYRPVEGDWHATRLVRYGDSLNCVFLGPVRDVPQEVINSAHTN